MFYGFRYFILLPTALAFKWFGINDIAASFFPYLASLTNVVVVYLIGKKIWDARIATVAAFLLAVYPLDISTANVLGPDSFIPLLSALSILCFLSGEASASKNGRMSFFICAGIMISFAYMCRITSIFLFFSMALYLIYYREYKIFLGIAAGLAIPLAVQAGYFLVQTGDPFFEITRITSESIVKTISEDYDVGLLFYPRNMLGLELSGLAMFGFLWWFVLVGLVLLWKHRAKERVLLLIVCLVIPFLGFEFGFQSIKEGVLISKNPNYLSLITAPAILIGAYCLQKAFNGLRSNAGTLLVFAVAAVLMITTAHVYGAYRMYRNVSDDAAPYIAVAAHLKSNPGSVVYTHHYRWPLFLKYFLRYNDAFYTFKTFKDLEMSGYCTFINSYIVLHRRYLKSDVRDRPVSQHLAYLEYEKNPPHHWKKVLSFQGTPLYNHVVLYEIK